MLSFCKGARRRLLRELQTEQRALAAQFAQQSGTVAQLQSDIVYARRERDAAQQQLERVQHLLATGNGVAAAPGALQRHPYSSPGFDLDALAITTTLPCTAAYIPAVLPGQQAAYHAGRPSAGPTPRQQRDGGSAASKTAAKPLKAGAGAAPASRTAAAGTATRIKAGKPGGRGWG